MKEKIEGIEGGVRLRIVRAIYGKEIRETLRDRRTLFLLLAMPMIFYPLMMVLIAEVAASQTSKLEATDGVIAIEGALPGEARDKLESGGGIEVRATDDPHALLEAGALQAVVEVPEGFRSALSQGESAPITVHYNSVDPLSSHVVERIRERLKGWKGDLLTRRLKAHGLDAAYIEPLAYVEADIAPQVRRMGSVASQFLPMLVLIFMVTGAFYPAIDLTAGERERKTIQTLMTSPVRPTEIVVGKYLTVLTIAVVSGAINIGSILLILAHSVALSGNEGLGLGVESISALDAAALFAVVMLLGLMFSALMMTIATLASSPKEAQNYLSPVYMICLMPVLIAQLPGIEMTGATAFIPVLNLALIMKEILIQGVVWDHLFLVTASTLIVTVLVLSLAARLYSREELMIGRAGAVAMLTPQGRVAPGQAAPLPTPGEAMAFVSILFVALYYLGSAAQSWHLMTGLLLTLYGILLGPTLGLSLWRRHDLKRVLHLSRPPALAMLGALLLGSTSFIWVSTGAELFHESFLPVPREFVELMEKTFSMPTDPLGKLGVILVVALSPAICEEAVFRGWLLSSFRGHAGGVVAVGVSALFFGIFHLSIYRFLGTTALGVLMGYVVWQSHSIWPSVLFHFLNNTLSLLSGDILPLLGVDVGASRAPVWLVLASMMIGAVGLLLVHAARRPGLIAARPPSSGGLQPAQGRRRLLRAAFEDPPPSPLRGATPAPGRSSARRTRSPRRRCRPSRCARSSPPARPPP